MGFDQKVQLSLIVLMTGIVIVFAVLIFLTFIIKGYSSAVRSIISGKKNEKKNASVAPVNSNSVGKDENGEDAKLESVSDISSEITPESENEPYVENGISEEVVAAISAAVYTLYGTSNTKVTEIRRVVQPKLSAWHMAGLLESTRPF